jgi:hypothetical protein
MEDAPILDSNFPLFFPSLAAPLTGPEKEGAGEWLAAAAAAATHATCLQRRCGSVVVKNDKVIGAGWNSLPGDECPLVCWKKHGDLSTVFKSDRTCCVHAEVRAITNALLAKENISGATLYFTSVDEKGRRHFSGAPYCTICSKFALEVGLGFFVLEHDFGVVSYPCDVYNKLSFSYGLRREI